MKQLVKILKGFLLPIVLTEIGDAVRESPLKTKLKLTDDQIEELIEFLEGTVTKLVAKI